MSGARAAAARGGRARCVSVSAARSCPQPSERAEKDFLIFFITVLRPSRLRAMSQRSRRSPRRRADRDDVFGPTAVVINLPRHKARRASVAARLRAAGVAFEWAPAVDGAALSSDERAAQVTPLGRLFMTPGMIGCFLSHRACWQLCVTRQTPLLVFEDDAVVEPSFAANLGAALAELMRVDASFDVLLVGALGCVHPRYRYGANVLHGLMGGGIRWPQQLSPRIGVPARAFGTHAYLVSPVGARKLLSLCPRANFHVDVAAWGQRSLRLYLATDGAERMLAFQAQLPGDTTIGGVPDRGRLLPRFVVDTYTGAEFGWAFNAPVLQCGGAVLTIGRSLCSTALLLALAAASASPPLWRLALGWFGLQFSLIQTLKATRWPRLAALALGALLAPQLLACAAPIAHSLRSLGGLQSLGGLTPSALPLAAALRDDCRLVAPSARGWALALATHLSLSVGVGATLGVLLFAMPRRSRRAAGVGVGVGVGVAVPLLVWLGRRRAPTLVTWMGAFLASTFGFATFFKGMSVAFGTLPKGADADLPTFVQWWTSLPEPLFAEGRRVRAAPGALTERASLLVAKLVSLGALLSVLLSTRDRTLPLRLPDASPALARWLVAAVQAEAHLWAIYLWASSCLDIGTLLVLLGGGTTEPPFRNPLLASRSLREAWGERWNRPVHAFLKRAVYRPARSHGLPALPAALLTFAASGLLHEYNFFVHNHVGYAPGRASAFFVLMGVLMLVEGALCSSLGRRCPPRVCALAARLPSALIAVGLQLAVLPAFAPLFMRSWLDSGMLEAVAGLMPHVECGGAG